MRGLFDRRRRRPSKRVPLAVVQQVLTLYRARDLRLHRPALPREAAGTPWDPALVPLGEDGGVISGEGPPVGPPSEGAAPAPAARYAAACRRKHAWLDSGAGRHAGPHWRPGGCPQRGLLGESCGQARGRMERLWATWRWSILGQMRRSFSKHGYREKPMSTPIGGTPRREGLTHTLPGEEAGPHQ